MRERPVRASVPRQLGGRRISDRPYLDHLEGATGARRRPSESGSLLDVAAVLNTGTPPSVRTVNPKVVGSILHGPLIIRLAERFWSRNELRFGLRVLGVYAARPTPAGKQALLTCVNPSSCETLGPECHSHGSGGQQAWVGQRPNRPLTQPSLR